jgi:hypothetical protein
MLLVRLCPINVYPRAGLPSSIACPQGAGKFRKICLPEGNMKPRAQSEDEYVYMLNVRYYLCIFLNTM